MKIIVASDLHGFLPRIEEPFDLLLLPGDLCPVWNHNRTYQWEWLTHEFVDWIKSLPFRDAFSRVVVCAGNHDLCLERPAILTTSRVTNIKFTPYMPPPYANGSAVGRL